VVEEGSFDEVLGACEEVWFDGIAFTYVDDVNVGAVKGWES
jgi:hypothetical protein